MTQEEFDKATPEEWAAEVERCKDPVYFYNTYWVRPDGAKPKQITKEEWEGLMEAANKERYKRRTPRLNYPLLPNDCFPITNDGILAQIQTNGENISYDSSNMPRIDKIISALKKEKYPTELPPE